MGGFIIRTPMIFFYIIVFVFVSVFVWHYSTKKYLNPYKLVFCFGKKGSGKSTHLSKMAYKSLIKGKKVYSTEDITIKYKNQSYSTIPLDPRKIYKYKFEEGSVILIDEVSLIWSNRDFYKMDPKVIEWFRYQRHYKVSCYLYSQSFDIDKKLRDLTDDFQLVTKFARVWSISRHMVRKPVVVHPSAEAPARIDDDIIEDGLLLAPFGGMSIAFIPYWAKLFDSFKKPDEDIPVIAENESPVLYAE